MTEFIQKFLFRNIGPVQNFVNNKLAKNGPFPKFWKWMEIGPRNYGKHVLPKFLRGINSATHAFAIRFNWARPHMTKMLFSREREVMITGYAIMFIAIAFWTRKNAFGRPLFQYSDAYLYHYDNPNHLSDRFGTHIPLSYTQYKVSAHYLEINKIFTKEMLKKFTEFENEVKLEYNDSTEKQRRTKYLNNPNYVYEPYGWEL